MKKSTIERLINAKVGERVVTKNHTFVKNPYSTCDKCYFLAHKKFPCEDCKKDFIFVGCK